MERRYFTLDVFTDTPLSGNPLAVVLDCDGLDDDRMQAIAGEFNLSETVFVFPPRNDSNRASLRIFTPKKELPFAGHPTVGTAILLATLDGLKPGQSTDLVLEEKVGPVLCRATQMGETTSAQFSLPKLPERQVIEFDRDLLAAGLGLRPDQLGINGHQDSICDGGVPFPVIGLTDLDAMASIEIDEAALEKCFGQLGFALELYVYTKQCQGNNSDYHTRMFAPAFGIAEDPATGSAAAAFAAQIVACDQPSDGKHSFIIEQGMEMARPSLIELSMEIAGDALIAASIGGAAVVISEGKLRI